MGAFSDCGKTLKPYTQGQDLVVGGYVYITPDAVLTVHLLTQADDNITVKLPSGMVFPMKVKKIFADTVATNGTLWILPDPY